MSGARSSTHIAGRELAQALVSGIHRVIEQQDLLNRINVFPVADGDTGTNLSLSLAAVLAVLERDTDPHLGTLLAAVADALLDASRGNSGAILAQFFQGLSDSAGEMSRFTPYTFSNAVTLGSEYAHDALSEPREGTILSVIAAFADSVRRQAIDHAQQDFRPVMTEALQRIEAALAETPQQLEVLRKAGVVDAGAKGFVAMISGMAEFIVDGRVAPQPDVARGLQEQLSFETSAAGEESAFRYCTECIVTGSDIDRRKLRESLSRLGDSLVLAGTKRKAKIHIHTDDPEQVFDVGRSYGDVGAEKADDMHRQHVSSHDATRRFAVITDSAADIPDEDMERLDIHMVPMRIQFGDRGYLDKVSISTEEFFGELATNPVHPTTSQPAPGDFRRQFQFLASHFPDVISVNVTSTVSGTVQAAKAAAARVDAPGRIHVVDSRSASLGQGLLAAYAAECARAGLDVDETLTALAAAIPATNAFAIVSDLRFAVRGGRIPAYVKTIADLLRLTPIIRATGDGRIGTAGFLLGRGRRIEKFARYIGRRVDATAPLNVAIGHAVCPGDASRLAESLGSRLGNIRRLSITELGTAFGVHGGPRTLVVATQPWRQPGTAD